MKKGEANGKYRSWLVTAVFAFAAIFICVLSNEAGAVPGFARQTGFSCNTCHYQHFPELNQFGANFKASGYTMTGDQGLIKGDFLNMPVVLNASLVTKIRYQKTNGDDDLVAKTNRGHLQFPDEAAFLAGGRAGDHIGFLLEAQFADPDAPTWASFKMPVVYEYAETKLGVVPFTTDAAGPSYGFELLNTGALRMQRVAEHRKETSSQQYIDTALQSTGVTFYAQRDLGHIAYTAWSPEHGGSDAKPYLHYYRAALTPSIGGWDLGLGIQAWKGATKYTEKSTAKILCTAPGVPDAACTIAGEEFTVTTTGFTEVTANALAYDAQAQGSVMGFPVGVYLTYAIANKTTPASSRPNLFNAGTNGDKKSFTALLEVGVIPARLTLIGAYRNADTGKAANSGQNATTFGANYLFTQNVALQLNHTMYSGSYYDLAANNALDKGDKLTTLMIFAAF